MSTDQDWEKFAAADPYWAVLTADEFKAENLNEANRKAFFQSGESHVAYVFSTLRRFFGAPERMGVSLDFGCGVGRLVVPLARRCDLAIGVDISETMRTIAAANARREGLANIEVIPSDDAMSALTHDLDLVHSVIVLQHIPPRRGYRILDALLKRLRPGGFGYIQVTYAHEMAALPVERGNTTGSSFRFYQRVDNQILKLVEQEDNAFTMQMNHYNLNEIMCVFWQHGIRDLFSRQTFHAGCLGIEYYFHRSK